MSHIMLESLVNTGLFVRLGIFKMGNIYKFLGFSYYATGDLNNALLNLDKAILLSNDDKELQSKYNEIKAKVVSQVQK